MFKRLTKHAILTMLPATFLLADFSYEQTSKMTGGAMASMMKVAGVFSKQAREPIRTTIAVKGDRMATLTNTNATVIDLSKETFTEIDFQKKTYSVMTFAEMKQFLEEMAKKQKDPDAAEAKFKISVKETGQTRQISGFDTREMILKMEMEVKDKKSDNAGTFVVTADMWIAPKVAGYDEIANFYRRMGEKIDWAPGGGMMTMGGSEVAKGMAEVYKEGSKLNGMPVLQTISMGGPGGDAQAQQQGGASAPQQQEAQAEKPSVGGALGGALGGRLGGFGGFGRKKKPAAEPKPAPAQQEQQAPAQQQGSAGSLLEMTTELSGFSAAAVDGSKFEVPAGFKLAKKKR